MAKKQISFNAFEMNCISHLSPGLWRYPNDKALNYKDIDYWQQIAKIGEKGLFDAIFIADVIGVYDIYGGNDLGALKTALQVPVNDPMQLGAVMAAVTENISFGITSGVPFEHPFPFARRLSTLDHLTKGRCGWNIVTGYLPSANRNMGSSELPHDERYELADEYMEVVYKLLEGSWEDDAVVLDRVTGNFANPAKIHHIGHHGKFFDVPGTHICEPSPQRTPVLFQAGNSPRGRKFAATHAEAIFIAPPTKEYAKIAVGQIRDALRAAGRDPMSAKIYLLATVITDATEELAQAKYKDLLSYANTEGSLVINSGWLGIDLSRYNLDDRLSNLRSNAMVAQVEALSGSKTPEGEEWTLRDLIKFTGIGCQGPKIIGSPSRVADILEEFIDESGADGFNLAYATTPGTILDVVEFVVPELQRRGRYKEAYAPGSLRNKMFGKGDRLGSEHIGSLYRIGGARSTINDFASTGRIRGKMEESYVI